MQNSDKRLSEVATWGCIRPIKFSRLRGPVFIAYMYRRKEYQLRIFGPHGYISEKRRVSDKDLISASQNAAAFLFHRQLLHTSIVRQFDRQKGVSEQIGFSGAGAVLSVAG